MASNEDHSVIAFFDLETTYSSSSPDRASAILEFGAVLVWARTLVEFGSFSTLVRPTHLSSVGNRPNGITQEAVASAPTFPEIADEVYHILHGRIWAGHNIADHDCFIIRKAFEEVGRSAPRPDGIIDSLDLLRERFERRAGNTKMATLATYFRLGKQTHRALDDVRMNLEIIKRCATVMFLESYLYQPDYFQEESCNYAHFLEPEEIYIPTVWASLLPSSRRDRVKLLDRDGPLQLYCKNLRVRLNINESFEAENYVSFVVDASPSRLCDVLDVCNRKVFQILSTKHGRSISSSWTPVVYRMDDVPNFATIRLHIPIERVGDMATYKTEMYQKDASGNPQRLEFSTIDLQELNRLFVKGKLIDAYLSSEVHDNETQASIRLVAKKLIVASM